MRNRTIPSPFLLAFAAFLAVSHPFSAPGAEAVRGGAAGKAGKGGKGAGAPDAGKAGKTAPPAEAGKPAGGGRGSGKGEAILDEARNRPIEITADRLQADAGKSSVSFEGNVVAVQGDVTLRSDRLFAEYSKEAGAIDRVTAEGNVRVVQAGREATGQKAVFHNLEQRIVLSGDVSLAEGENRLRGESVTILLRENRSVVSGGETGGRVKAVLFPKGLAEGKEKVPR